MLPASLNDHSGRRLTPRFSKRMSFVVFFRPAILRKIMTNDEIRSIVKHSIARITSISPEEIADNASYKGDLKLDSLTILEIAVDTEYQFKIRILEDELSAIDTIEDTVNIVQQHLSAVTSG